MTKTEKALALVKEVYGEDHEIYGSSICGYSIVKKTSFVKTIFQAKNLQEIIDHCILIKEQK